MDRRNEVIEIRDADRTVCEVWTRVMGYYRPIAAFNKGKKSEYQERKCFSERKGNKTK